jgi:hypothetical protein
MHKYTLEPTLKDFADVFAREKIFVIFLALVCLGFAKLQKQSFCIEII